MRLSACYYIYLLVPGNNCRNTKRQHFQRNKNNELWKLLKSAPEAVGGLKFVDRCIKHYIHSFCSVSATEMRNHYLVRFISIQLVLYKIQLLLRYTL